MSRAPLPIDAALPDLRAALAREGRAVLVAPPGAGKTTRVPLALLDDITGRIVMLEPRRLAARAAAQRLAEELGESPGKRVGFRMRGESLPGSRIEVVTEGILTRMLQSDPSLEGIGAVIFDEFHERSLNADLGLALTLEARAALRPGLVLLVMSATLAAEPVAELMGGAPVIRSEGRAFPVETRWLPRPLPGTARLEAEAAALIRQALAETDPDPGGTLLAFLPGEGEIRRVAAMLADTGAEILPLYGALPPAAQRAALSPPGKLRRVVLATSIAETSLTIPAVRVVVDAGRARRARFDPGSGMSRLVTERASRAEADQRRGRAGRLAPGICYRLWARAKEGALPAAAPPEITNADLAPLALELAAWGASETDLAFLTPPPEGALAEARALLADLGALDGAGRITAHGRALATLPLHPRLGHMLVMAGRRAAGLAALISDRDPLRGAPADLTLRLSALAGRAQPFPADPGALARLRAEERRLTRLAPASTPFPDLTPGGMAALAYPDRIGQRRKGAQARFILSGGRGAVLADGDGLGASPLIVATDLDGAGRESRIRTALPVAESELRALFSDRIHWQDSVTWDRREGRVQARQRETLGALTLGARRWDDAPPEALALAALGGLRAIGLTWSPAAARLRARIALLPDLGPVDDDSLLADADWLLPFLTDARSTADLRAIDLQAALLAKIGWDGQQRLNREAPPHFVTPMGRKAPIDYAGEAPAIEVRLQEMFGLTTHPHVAGQPLRITLTSPAGRPLQVTMDLPGFWASSYGDVRKDMRGRYPRHPWPEDPTQADPTLRAKPRGR